MDYKKILEKINKKKSVPFDGLLLKPEKVEQMIFELHCYLADELNERFTEINSKLDIIINKNKEQK